VIYDVSNDPNWRNGSHKGYTAGKDLTKEIKEASPHGTSALNRVPIVGKIKP
jgi:predicted heme/steroid binding protein